MGRRKIDIKINHLIQRCVSLNQRVLCLQIGPRSRDQIVLLSHLLQKVRKQNGLPKQKILWCFKKDDKFSFIVKKLQKSLKKKCSGEYSVTNEDCFDYFLASCDITFCHYSETIKVLGQTFGMLVIQDFEAVIPNTLARIIECVEGGGLISIFLPNIQSLDDIPSLKMDAHSRYVTSAFPKVDPVFNYRFVLSLLDCKNCVIMDDNFHLYHISTELSPPLATKVPGNFKCDKKESGALSPVFALCRTKDQTNVLQVFIEQLMQKNANYVVSLTSARGRGKSAALGLAVAAALNLKYSNIYVTSPQLDNVQTLFSFMIKGLNALELKEKEDYAITFLNENQNLVCGLCLFRDHKQTIYYLPPIESSKAHAADVIVIDEAAAVPLPLVKNWLNYSKVFMASTINGYEGTGRSLSLKLLNQLRKRSVENSSTNHTLSKNFKLHEVTLNEAIRYADRDEVESWLNNLFCLNSETGQIFDDFPNPESCELYYVNKNVLFSYHKVAEMFLQQLVSLFVSSHYKNCPNDLLMMADAPSHQLFCLLAPGNKKARALPTILCVIQIALEGKIPKDRLLDDFSHGKRASGDLIPWIISQQFQDNEFPLLSGARIVRIATHPDCQGMGYGQRALKLLFSHYKKGSKHLQSSKENCKPTLLLELTELHSEKLDYVGVSYGLTLELLKFWKKLEFTPLYLRQTASEITGEHSCIMIKGFNTSFLMNYASDFLGRFVELLSSAFRNLSTSVALEIIHCNIDNQNADDPLPPCIFSARSLKRLEAYCNHLVDYHLILDLISPVARNYFLGCFKLLFLSPLQEAVLLSFGLQNKSFEEIALELKMETNQIMGLFTKVIKKVLPHLTTERTDNLRENNSKHKKATNENFSKRIRFS